MVGEYNKVRNGMSNDNILQMTFPDVYEVSRIRVIGTDLTIYSVWVPIKTPGLRSGFQTITSCKSIVNGSYKSMWWGKLGTEELPDELSVMKPLSDERMIAVRTFQEMNYWRAYLLIHDRYPDIRYYRNGSTCSMGEIMTVGESK